jgi:hypothetical protein
MMKVSAIFLVLATIVNASMAADVSFWQQLTPEERRAAGVDQLTPGQQAVLNQLAGRFAREGARQVREEAKAEVRDQVKKEVREEVKRELKTEQKVHEEARLGLPAEYKDATIRSRIVGKFNGWSGATVFQLNNGQTWVQTDSSADLWIPTVENPEVEIRSSKIGGWKLYLVENGFWLRVRRVK